MFFPVLCVVAEGLPSFLHKQQDEQRRQFGTSHTYDRSQGY